MSEPSLKVLQSYREPKPTTNPYIATLTSRLRELPDVEILTFSFPRAIFGRYDVFHAHWPEVMMSGHNVVSRIGRQLLSLLFVLRLAVTRVPVVRTVHNLELPTVSWLPRILLGWLDRMTTLRICLNERTASEVKAPTQTILHGDYRARYAGLSTVESSRGLVQYFGLVRRYKGVESLISAFRAVGDGSLRLRISGSPSSSALAESLDEISAGDPRITTEWMFLDDRELATRVSEAELVVLPYRFMHNSGAVLTALSLDRPVLVPDNEVNRDLAREVGRVWVQTFRDELRPEDVVEALRLVRARSPQDRPDLTSRDWGTAARDHRDAYRFALNHGHRK